MDKKISELDQALQINNDAVFPISQDNGGTDTTYKVSITQISAEIGEDQTFSNLDTTDKTLVGAINEVAQGGGGGGSSTLDGLTDVDIDDQTLSDGQVLKYDSAEDKWINDDVGAGGHTIVADDGTDLAQRANLQFKGAYSEDNSVDDTTEVNVVRNMTRAQFNQLSADEKVGLINISDESLSATEIPMSPSDPDFVADRITALESGGQVTYTPITTGISTNASYIYRKGNTLFISIDVVFSSDFVSQWKDILTIENVTLEGSGYFGVITTETNVPTFVQAYQNGTDIVLRARSPKANGGNNQRGQIVVPVT